MYLLIRADRSPVQTSDNLTAADLLAVKEGSVHIYRLSVEKRTFQRLVFDVEKPCWVPVAESKILAAPGVHLHS